MTEEIFPDMVWDLCGFWGKNFFLFPLGKFKEYPWASSDVCGQIRGMGGGEWNLGMCVSSS